MPSGSCMCGAVKYSYTDSAMKAICHCLSCRKLTGSTYATTILVPETSFKLAPITTSTPENGKEGEESKLKISKTVHETGMDITIYGCRDCPTTLYKRGTGFPGLVIVLAGTLDDVDKGLAEEGKPDMELWTKYRVRWSKPVDGAAQFEGFPPA